MKLSKLLGILGAVGYAFDAQRGFAGEGHNPNLRGYSGAASEVGYQAAFGPEVEKAFKGTIHFMGNQMGAGNRLSIQQLQSNRGVSPVDSDLHGPLNGVAPQKMQNKVPAPEYESNSFWDWLMGSP